jgi:hypothetical protein
MKLLLAAAAGIALGSGCVAVNIRQETHRAPASSPETSAILATVDAFLIADGNRDAAGLKAVVAPDAPLWVQRITKEGEQKPRKLTFEALVPAAGGDPFIEQYWNPLVQVRGGLATVWAPYELRDKGQLKQCGIDAFDLVKTDGRWLIASALSTLEPDACTEFTPPSVSALRPRDGWKEHVND